MSSIPRSTSDSLPKLVAWYCQECGRQELPPDERYCPACGEKMQRCSRYEWFLADALAAEFVKRGRTFRIDEQWWFVDHRGFRWYFDLRVWVDGPCPSDGTKPDGGAGRLVEINGPEHSRQKKYSGPGGGYTRDEDKQYEYDKATPRGSWLDAFCVSNDECARKGGVVYRTAEKLANSLCSEADDVY